MIRNPVLMEMRAQQRARGITITKPSPPVIGSRPFDPRTASSPEERENARRLADYHSRRAGLSEPRLQLRR